MSTLTRFWTLAEFRAKLRMDLDLEEETFVRPQELDDYINEAIDEAESEIHGLYEDYFLTRSQVSLVQGQEEYDMPDNIYGDKIRRIMYNNTSTVYKIKRIKDWKKFEVYEIAQNFSTSDLYQYFLVNSAAAEPKILLVPTARESGPYMTIWYIRQANRLVLPEDKCDIKEAHNFILQHAKTRIYEKEGHPNTQKSMADLERERQIMVTTLASRVPDADNEIELDTSFYEEMS